ncbi:unnamed protein product [Alopecurus aequalis]
MEPETSHHAMINCTKAKALWQCLRKEWSLPDEYAFRYTGQDWVLILLSQLYEQLRAKLLLLWWRSWHLRNNIIFDDGKCRIEQSSIFLKSILASNKDKRNIEALSNPKGKWPIIWKDECSDSHEKEAPSTWKRPDWGWAKLNWDASYWDDENKGGWGAVLRNNSGDVLLTAWGEIDNCPNPEMAEAIGGLQSVRSILPHYAGPIHLENDCSSIITELKGDGRSKSAISGTIRDIRSLLETMQDHKVSKINRSGNTVAHKLARICRSGLGENVLVGSAPPCVVSLINRDCNEFYVI